MREAALILCVVALCAAATCPTAYAEDVFDDIPAATVAPAADVRLQRTTAPRGLCFPREDAAGWRFEFTGGGWTAGARGNNTIGTRRNEVDSDPIDAVKALTDQGSAFVLGRVRVYYDRWGVRLAGATARLSDGYTFREGTSTGIPAEIGMDLIQGDLVYRVARHAVGGSATCPSTLTYELFAGGRYVNLEGTIRPRGVLPGVTDTRDFIDPYVGGRVIWDISNRWSFDFEVDIGGFGVGSDQAFHLRGGVRYRVARWLSAEVGYEMLNIEFLEGAGASLFDWDILFHGPYIAATIHL